MTERRLGLLFVLTVLLPAAGLGAVAASAASDEARLAALQREERRRIVGVQVRDGLRERIVGRLRAVSERAARGDDLRGLRALEPEALALDPALGLLAPAAPWTGPGAVELAPPPPAWLAPALALEARPAELLEALAARTAGERAEPAALAAASRALRALGRAGEALAVDRALVAGAATPPTTRWLARERVTTTREEAATVVDELLAGGGGGLTPGVWWTTLEAACARVSRDGAGGDVARLESARPALRLARAAALVAAVGSRALGTDASEEATLLLVRAGPLGGGDGLLALGPPGPVRAGLVVGGDELARLARDLARVGVGEVEVDLVAGGAGEPLGGGLSVVARAVESSAAAEQARRRALARGAVLGVLVLTIVGGSLLGARALRRSAELARLRGDFVASVTHELRTPVTSIRAMAEVLGHGKLEPARQAEYFQAIALEARRLGRRIEDALAAARLERGAIQPRPEPVDLAAAATAVVEHARPAAVVAGQTITLEAAADLRPARVDPALLEQALENLLDNALKHGRPRDGAPGSVRVVVRAAGPATSADLELVVEDTGPGIAPGERGRVLEPFFRGAASAGTPGAGLGLAIVRSIAEAHGGSVQVQAAPGGGAAISLRLPAWPVFTSEEEGP